MTERGWVRRLARGLPLALGALLAACLPAPPVSEGGASAVVTSFSEPLAPLFAALLALERGQRNEPVVIVQLGDSHTAGDRFSGHLRALFQQRFGASGRGSLPPGVPFEYYRPQLVAADMTGGWAIANSFREGTPGPFGLSGFRVSASDPRDRMTLRSTEIAGFDVAAIEYLRQPGGGRFAVRVDGRLVSEQPTAADTAEAAWLDVPIAAASRGMSVTPLGDGPVEFLAWMVERQRPGIIYDSHGVVGATIDILGAWDPATVAGELRRRDPAMIVVAYGTNEGFHDRLEPEAYEAAFASRLAALRQAAPRAAVLVVGPPDANRLQPGCAAAPPGCVPPDAPGRDQCRWHTPPNLAMVRETQRRVAVSLGAEFWDWSKVMGGVCGTHRWATAEPPLAYPDRVHLRDEGHRLSAERLFAQLVEQYAAYAAWAGNGLAARR